MAEAAYKYDDEYVLKEVFDARMDRMEMLIKKNQAETRGEIQTLRAETRGEIKALSERLNGAIDTLTMAINRVDTRMDGIEKRIDDIHQSQSRMLALWGLIITVAVALIQHFWK